MSYQTMPSRRLVSQEDASMIQRPDVPRSRFKGAWTAKKTFDAGYLVPFLVDEILPGDQMSYDVTAYVRLATPLFPMLDNQRIDTFFFFVPNRILWSNWVRFMGEQDRPTDTITYTIPQIVSPVAGFAANSIYDHFGIPCVGQIAAGQTISINALPIRAYDAIFRAWFRDENLTNAGVNAVDNGPDPSGNYVVRQRAKSHDYFTSALPWPQKFTAPSIPLLGTAPVRGIGIPTGVPPAVIPGPLNVNESTNVNTTYGGHYPTSTVGGPVIKAFVSNPAFPDVFADLSMASATFTVNALREAFSIQTLLERDARGGTRYIELVKSHFGVTSPDARLQRPEYIGGGSSPLNITPIAQTATGGSGVGSLGAAGTAVGAHRASFAATEHGYVIGIINVRSELSYQQGLHKMWSRSTRYDFYWPSLAGLGEQAILTREIYCTGDPTNDTTVFGYQERWQEYRTRTSEVTGQFRSTTAGTIDPWHLAQRFTSAPVLGNTFIIDTPPMSRVLAAGATAANMQYLADILIQRSATRPIPVYGTPMALGRF